MKKIILATLIAILFSGCSKWISVNPLSPPLKLDEKLEGTWKFESKEGEEVYLHIGKKTENTMLALSVEHKKDGSLDIVEIPFFVTMTGTDNYLNVRYKDLDETAEENEDGFIFVKYTILGDNKLSLYQFDPEIIISAVQSGKLKGEICNTKIASPQDNKEKSNATSKKKIDSIRITDTSENMIKFFNTEGNKFVPEVMKFDKIH